MLYHLLWLLLLLIALKLLLLLPTTTSFAYYSSYNNNNHLSKSKSISQLLLTTTTTTPATSAQVLSPLLSSSSITRKKTPSSTTTTSLHYLIGLGGGIGGRDYYKYNNKYNKKDLVSLQDSTSTSTEGKEEGEGRKKRRFLVVEPLLRNNKLTTAMFAGRDENWKIHLGLFLFYWLVLGNIVFPKLLMSNTATATSSSSLMAIIFSTIWLGFVLAISGMEAWLKFRAPFCPRAYALDIGRTIFPALNIVELALCLVCWQNHPLISTGNIFDGLPICTIILIFDMIWLTPKLVTRGKQVVYQHILKEMTTKSKGGSSSTYEYNAEGFRALESEMNTTTTTKFEKKKDKWHIVYVLLEFIKMIALGNCIVVASNTI